MSSIIYCHSTVAADPGSTAKWTVETVLKETIEFWYTLYKSTMGTVEGNIVLCRINRAKWFQNIWESSACTSRYASDLGKD